MSNHQINKIIYVYNNKKSKITYKDQLDNLIFIINYIYKDRKGKNKHSLHSKNYKILLLLYIQ